ncbi:glycosyltransferase [Paenibacillus sp. strain BS8-2]
MKKKLLFVMNNLHCGGAEKSLVSLLNHIDYSRYQVDLLLFKREGIFMKQLPPEVTLVGDMQNYQLFDMPIGQAIRISLRQRDFRIAFARIGAGFIFRSKVNAAQREQKLWKYLSTALPPISIRYDAAIGFLEKTPVYYCLDKVDAEVKIGFVHNDYEKLGMDPAYDREHFGKLDYLVTVSDICSDVLLRLFPEHMKKVKVIQNIVSPDLIVAMSHESERYGIPSLENEFTIVSVGRLNMQKGFDMAAHACRLLLDRGIHIRWYIVGEGEERRKLELLIETLELREHFYLVGLQDNPYAYIRRADLYVQPSRFEGKSIAIDEAKILGMPIVVTHFSTAEDQISHGKNGWIVEMNAEALAEGIAALAGDPSLRQTLSEELKQERLGTAGEVEKLYELIAGGGRA